MFVDQDQVMAPTRTPMQEIALRAADLIDEKGWIQHNGRTADGICIQWAIGDVTLDASGLSGMKLINRLAKHVGAFRLFEWNDAAGRTKEEVIGLLRAYANGEIK